MEIREFFMLYIPKKAPNYETINEVIKKATGFEILFPVTFLIISNLFDLN